MLNRLSFKGQRHGDTQKGTTEDPNIHKQLPEMNAKHLVACENLQQGAVPAR